MQYFLRKFKDCCVLDSLEMNCAAKVLVINIGNEVAFRLPNEMSLEILENFCTLAWIKGIL